jgi:hypothetical protein
MSPTPYLVTRDHTSEYPRPLTLAVGDRFTVGKKYDGPEDWSDWYFCSAPGQESGWVPATVIEIVSGDEARAREAYSARELTVRAGERLLGQRTLNGWAWCEHPVRSESGWIPLANLREDPVR